MNAARTTFILPLSSDVNNEQNVISLKTAGRPSDVLKFCNPGGYSGTIHTWSARTPTPYSFL